MTDKKIAVVYVDHTMIALLSSRVHRDDPAFDDWNAANILWRRLREERIRLVTHGKDTEMDIILWLNRQGCCITDTLRAIEAIKEFELWGKDEKSRIQQYKQMLAHFEELELLQPQTENHEDGQKAKEIISVLKLNNEESHRDIHSVPCLHILRTCLSDLGNWYTANVWSDLKRTDYQLNWQLLESVLAKEGIEPAFQGTEGVPNRYLFGLLNRAIGLAKKSCGKLPVPDSHISFVTNMVLQKYGDDQVSRGILHILHCVRNGIECYVTTNHPLMHGFAQHKSALKEYLQLTSLNLDLMSPQRLIEVAVS